MCLSLCRSTHPDASIATQPVPDVTQALIDGFVDQGMSTEQAEEKIEHLKEEERYVLEVY